MNKNNLKSSKELLDEEIEKIEDIEQKDRIKFLLNDYSQPKFKINAPMYVLFITLIFCFFWQNKEQRSYIESQQEDISNLIFYIMYMSADIVPSDSTLNTIEPFDFEQIQLPQEFHSKEI